MSKKNKLYKEQTNPKMMVYELADKIGSITNKLLIKNPYTIAKVLIDNGCIFRENAEAELNKAYNKGWYDGVNFAYHFIQSYLSGSKQTKSIDIQVIRNYLAEYVDIEEGTNEEFF